LAATSDDSAAIGSAASADLTFVGIEERKVVIVGQLFTGFDVSQCEKRHPVKSVDRPFLHFAIGSTRMVDKSAFASHTMPVDDCSSVKM
jgi:hypothetical protein